jgi:hypothetical protein
MHSYITIICYIVFIWCIMYFALGNSVLEPLFEDFQEQVFEEPEIFLVGNEASVLDQLCGYFSYLFCRM